jgi:hypothetical protein
MSEFVSSRIYEISKTVIKTMLAIGFFCAQAESVTEDDKISLFKEIESMLSTPDGTEKLRSKANEMSEGLADALANGDSREVAESAFLMRYAQPVENWDSAIGFALSSGDDEKVEAALSVLAIHNVVGPTSRDVLSEQIRRPSSNRIFSAMARVAGRSSLTEVIPVLEEALLEDDTERSIGAVTGLIEFGNKASDVIPSLEKRLRRLRKPDSGASIAESYFKNLPTNNREKHLEDLLQEAITSLSKAPVQMASVIADQNREEANESNPIENYQSDIGVDLNETVKESSDKGSGAWSWLYILFLFGVIAGAIALFRSRRENRPS